MGQWLVECCHFISWSGSAVLQDKQAWRGLTWLVVCNCHYFLWPLLVTNCHYWNGFRNAKLLSWCFFEICSKEGFTNNPCQRCWAMLGVYQAPAASLIRVEDIWILLASTILISVFRGNYMLRKNVRLNHNWLYPKFTFIWMLFLRRWPITTDALSFIGKLCHPRTV